MEDVLVKSSTPSQILLDVSKSISAHTTLRGLLNDLKECLSQLIQFEVLTLALFHPERNTARLHVIVKQDLPAAEKDIDTRLAAMMNTELPVDATPVGFALGTGQPVYVPSIDNETRFPIVLDAIRRNGGRCFCSLPLITARRKIGTLTFATSREDAYTPENIELMEQIAMQVTVAVENTLNHEDLARERDRLQLLLEINNALVSQLDVKDLLRSIALCLRRVFTNEFIGLSLYDPQTKRLQLQILDLSDREGLIREEILDMSESHLSSRVFAARRPIVLRGSELAGLAPRALKYLSQEGLESICSMPLVSRGEVLGGLKLASRDVNAFTPDQVDLLWRIAGQVAIAIDNSLSYQKIEDLKNKLAEEKLYLEDEIRTYYQFEDIIGRSDALRRILQHVETVAPTDSTVLIQGETGTGKELIARAIHNLSTRNKSSFVKLNCAAIPTGLIESELLGHEKGAFTGAIAQKLGRFELAHRGSLFLDEIGEIPLEMQPKLLRVLQEKEFERLGGTRTLQADVRLIAATNRDLQQMVNDREFRADLFYRLNVFPVTVPPLRERPEDIPLLVRYFVQMFSRRMNRVITTIPSEAMEALVKYPWPGNIRELQNLVERAVILSPAAVLRVPIAELKAVTTPAPPSTATLEDVEREHILRALKETHGVIGGPNGAAARLGMKRTTLQSRMQKFGIAYTR
ncbi:MAG: sigma 54-interacting transcriptional regulator [Bryobacteraceae bacterium]